MTAVRGETRAAAAYRVVLPAGWRRAPLGEGAGATVDDLVRTALSRLPATTPPDDLARLRPQLRGRLREVVRAAADGGGVDLLLPVEPVAGVALPMSLVVGLVPVDGPSAPVVAALLAADEHAQAVPVGPVVAVRSVEVGEGWQRVTHLVPPLTGDCWAAVTAHVEDVEGGTAVMVELADAVVSTWRWER